ncbi:hypothetical protein MLP_42180 [Microlunatus phosphovorus NM-1]|uniref:peptidyl-tRNA hydrolase n=1 Tax=Microlunatus phosphovorus (strain ATCC 700054 / DSM 10555 / JCM 9379 / NBRC 101784 / NCIMB 13414 / VKM Ac-1990 / NM-1) TaxID=1032480 RepID=F5XS19_MICPN|nr:aminoacyl-tRNA hydrolase [Microlunatus phosphovorus]BAK37232.1 hypothetical protein MLP_42180 [Microlunatus phosphovorus NM-1]
MTTNTALAPLRARYGYWLGLNAAEVEQNREEAAEDIRALQLLIRMERDRPPSWHRALELAASGAAAICLDPRAEPGGEWFDAVAAYCAGHIRKVTRRGRGAQWEATADIPGLTLTSADTQVRALVPGLVSQLDKRVSKLQVGGTDVDRDDPGPAPTEPDRVLRLLLPPSLSMTMGKAMAQTGHAGMIAAALMADGASDALSRWIAAGCPAHVDTLDQTSFAQYCALLADPASAWREHRLLAVRDAGFTEVDPGTITVIAIAPA